MTTAPLFLIAAAVADWFISLRPFKAIASRVGLDHEQLEKKLPPLTQPHTFRGQLEAALAEPRVRPDLIPQKIHLARLEEQLTVLLKQRDRAEDCIDRFRSRAEGYSDSELLKAEIFANRVQQQCVKLIKDIEKDRQALQKAAAEPAPNLNPSPTAVPAPHRMTNDQAQLKSDHDPATNDHQLTTAQSPTPTSTPRPFNPITAGAAEIPLTPPATTDEYLNCLVKNRHRLKNTPAKDRQALIARLIEEHRVKTMARAA